MRTKIFKTFRATFTHPWMAIVGISFSFFLASYDTTAFNLALVTIQQDLGLDLSELDWVMTSMMLALGTFLVPAGKISDKYGHKYPMVIGLFFFSLISLLGGFAVNAWQLITLRILQGVSAALFWPGMQILSLHIVAEKHKTLAVGVTQFANAVGIASGPILSGIVITHLSWRWIFWTTVPFSLISLFLLLFSIPTNLFKKARHKIDFLSAFFLSGAVFAGIHALDLIGRHGINYRSSLAWSAIAVALLWFFIMRDDNIKEPLIDREILQNKRYTSGVLLRISSATIYFSFLFITGFALQQIATLAPEEAGFFFLPLTIGLMGFSLFAGFLIRWFNLKKLMFSALFGLVIACFSYGMIIRYTFDFWVVAAPLGFLGMMFGIFGPTNTVFTIGALPKQFAATGAGVLTMTMMVFGSVGIVVSSIFIRTLGVATSLHHLAKTGMSLTEKQKTFIELAMMGEISVKQALIAFGDQAEPVYLAIRKGFFFAMSWNLFTLGIGALIAFLILFPLHYRKINESS